MGLFMFFLLVEQECPFYPIRVAGWLIPTACVPHHDEISPWPLSLYYPLDFLFVLPPMGDGSGFGLNLTFA